MDTLPRDVLVMILRITAIKDVPTLELVCREWRDILEHENADKLAILRATEERMWHAVNGGFVDVIDVIGIDPTDVPPMLKLAGRRGHINVVHRLMQAGKEKHNDWYMWRKACVGAVQGDNVAMLQEYLRCDDDEHTRMEIACLTHRSLRYGSANTMRYCNTFVQYGLALSHWWYYALASDKDRTLKLTEECNVNWNSTLRNALFHGEVDAARIALSHAACLTDPIGPDMQRVLDEASRPLKRQRTDESPP